MRPVTCCLALWGNVGITLGRVSSPPTANMSYDVVRALLRSPESLQCLLDIYFTEENTTVSPGSNTTPIRRGQIAVVSHRDQSQRTELGRWVLQ